MKSARKNQEMIKKLTLVAMFTAIVAILAYMGGFIKIGALASISLTLIPVVLGGAICGPLVGAWLGLVSGAVFFATADAAYWLGLSAGGTIVTVLLKGLLAGLYQFPMLDGHWKRSDVVKHLKELGLCGFASWMKHQAKEEVEHGLKIFDYLIDCNSFVTLKQIHTPEFEFNGILSIFNHIYEHEQCITNAIMTIAQKAEEENDIRLLDVLDIHYYTEAKGVCGERSCNHYDNDECIKARLDSVRSFYDETYRENSWITDTGAEFFPLLPNIKKSIDTYYPETKLAFTEYNFGGGDHISGAVTQADTLGIFAENDVYFATIWSFDHNEYQLAAINMFTNYDGLGNGFGDTLVKSEENNENISVYSSVDSEDESVVKIIVTNRNINDETPVTINLSSEEIYGNAEVYSLFGDTPEIRQLDGIESISENIFSYTLPALSVTEFAVYIKEEAVNIPIIVIAGISIIVLIIIGIIIFKKLAHK